MGYVKSMQHFLTYLQEIWTFNGGTKNAGNKNTKREMTDQIAKRNIAGYEMSAHQIVVLHYITVI